MTADPTLVFEPSTDPDDALTSLERALVEAAATRGAGAFEKVFEKTPSPSIEVHRWVHDGEGTVVDLTFDSKTPAMFVSVMGAGAANWWQVLRARLDVPDTEEFIDNAHESMHPVLIVLAALATWAGPNARLQAVVVEALASADDDELLTAGIEAAALLTWPALREPLKKVAASKTVSDELKQLAQVALTRYSN